VKSISNKNLLINSNSSLYVETTSLNADMRKFELSQKEESRTHSADSSKAYSKLNAF